MKGGKIVAKSKTPEERLKDKNQKRKERQDREKIKNKKKK